MKTNTNSSVTCGCYLVLFIFNFFIGAWSVNYLLQVFLGKVIPFFAAGLIGLVAAEVSVPVAIVVWLLKLFNVF